MSATTAALFAPIEASTKEKIRKLIHVYQRRTQLDVTELESAANLGIANGLNRYDETQPATLESWCVSNARWAIQHAIAADFRQRRKGTTELPSQLAAPTRTTLIDYLRRELSDDAALLLDMVLQAPPSVTEARPQSAWKEMREVLAKRGWSIERMQEAHQAVSSLIRGRKLVRGRK